MSVNENEKSVEELFYYAIAEMLGCNNHNYRLYPYSKRTRWNNREPGNGRYVGYGIVRRHSANHIVVQLHTPKVIGQYDSEQLALDAIKKSLDLDRL